MKNIFILISVFLLSLLSTEIREISFHSEGQDAYVCSSDYFHDIDQDIENINCITPLESDLPCEDMVYTDVQSLSRQLRSSGRLQRMLNVHFSFLNKMLEWKKALNRLEMLSYASFHTYTTIPCQSWALASEHYVFGMCRILV